MGRPMRWVAVVVMAALALPVVAMRQITPVADNAGVSVTVTVPVTGGCEESEPCWNPCTRGVTPVGAEGPGPCDVRSILPYGATLTMGVAATADRPCAGESGLVVDVAAWRDGAMIARTSQVECVARGDEGSVTGPDRTGRAVRWVATQVDEYDKAEGRYVW